jgi:hypothetical protein
MRASKPARLFASKCAPDEEEEDLDHLVPAKMKVAQLKVRVRGGRGLWQHTVH